jgi:hypothetical protein
MLSREKKARHTGETVSLWSVKSRKGRDVESVDEYPSEVSGGCPPGDGMAPTAYSFWTAGMVTRQRISA